MEKCRPKTILAGDIGGTKTRLAVFSSWAGLNAPMAEATFPSRDYPSLEVIVQLFLSRVDTPVHHAIFGVAGPVVNGQAKITNLPWVLEETALADTLELSSVHLLNDLMALACAVPLLKTDDLHTLNNGQVIPGGVIAVVAPGTGLGEAYLTWDGDGYEAHPSEGGHTDFAPTNAQQVEMLLHLLDQYDHVSMERICSGMGLPHIYAYLKETGQEKEPNWLSQQLASVDDPTPVIVAAALDMNRPCRLCQVTLETFIAILGAEAGNMALKVMATGGVYLGGGILHRILPVLKQGALMDAFRRNGRMSKLMEDIPVHVILNPKAAILGAAWYGVTHACHSTSL